MYRRQHLHSSNRAVKINYHILCVLVGNSYAHYILSGWIGKYTNETKLHIHHYQDAAFIIGNILFTNCIWLLYLFQTCYHILCKLV